MRKVYILLLVAVCVMGCNKSIITGAGTVVEESRNTATFNGLNVSGNVKVHLTAGPQISVKLKGYSNLLPEFVTEVKNNNLYLHYRDGVSVRNDNVEVFVTMPEIVNMDISGSSLIDAVGNFDSVEALRIGSSGNGKVSIDHVTAASYTVSTSGNADVSTLGVTASNATIEISGNATVSLSVTEKLNVNISGNGTVSYKGDPEIVSNISGNGKIIKL